MNDADTCRKYVVPKLQAAGWGNEPHSLTEPKSFNDGASSSSGARRAVSRPADGTTLVPSTLRQGECRPEDSAR
jgi:type I restriction enzyme R subunit